MRIVEITPLSNGGRNNQTTDFAVPVPDGWAVIPDDMECENFPFGEITVEEIDGVKTVVKWIPGVMPEPTPVTPQPTLESRVSSLENAIMEGLNL